MNLHVWMRRVGSCYTCVFDKVCWRMMHSSHGLVPAVSTSFLFMLEVSVSFCEMSVSLWRGIVKNHLHFLELAFFRCLRTSHVISFPFPFDWCLRCRLCPVWLAYLMVWLKTSSMSCFSCDRSGLTKLHSIVVLIFEPDCLEQRGAFKYICPWKCVGAICNHEFSSCNRRRPREV